MKTKHTNPESKLPNRTEQLSTEKTVPNSDSRPAAPRIDFARRRANRALGTEQLIALLRTEAPRFYEVAEVVGRWVWIQFAEKQPPQVTTVLAELGFHWNNKRQTWQHPCGALTQSSPTDPREKYGSRHPADLQPA